MILWYEIVSGVLFFLSSILNGVKLILTLCKHLCACTFIFINFSLYTLQENEVVAEGRIKRKFLGNMCFRWFTEDQNFAGVWVSETLISRKFLDKLRGQLLSEIFNGK